MPPTVDVTNFTDTQKQLLSSAASLGTGINTINTRQLSGNTQPIQLAPFQSDANQLKSATTSVPDFNKIYADYNTPTATEQERTSLTSQLRAQLDSLSSQGAYIDAQGNIVAPDFKAKKSQELGVTSLKNEIGDITSQLDALKAEANAIPLDIQNEFQGRGATIGGTQPIEQSRLRENTTKALRLAAIGNFKLNKLSAAERDLESAIQAEFGNRIATINNLKETLALNKDALEREDKKKTAKLEGDIKNYENQLKRDMDEKRLIQEVFMTAGQNKADNSTLQKVLSAKTVNDAIAIAGKFLAPPDKPNLQVVDLGKDKDGNDLGKALIDLNKNGQVVRSYGGVPEGSNPAVFKGKYGSLVNVAAGLVGAERGKTSKATISTALGEGDYVTAWAGIANNVEESLTGESKTRFSSQRTDYKALSGLKSAIQAYAAGGGNMGLLRGTEEDIKRKLGIDSGKASALAVQLWREFQTYRVNMTGAAFSQAESRDYASVNPTLGKSLDLNMSVIDGSLNQLENRILSTVETRVPHSTELYKEMNTQFIGQGSQPQLSTDEAYQKYLKMTQSR